MEERPVPADLGVSTVAHRSLESPCTPRRRLSMAIKFDAQLAEGDIDARSKASQSLEVAANCVPGLSGYQTEKLLHRRGRKVGGHYCLISVFLEEESCRLRFSVNPFILLTAKLLMFIFAGLCLRWFRRDAAGSNPHCTRVEGYG